VDTGVIFRAKTRNFAPTKSKAEKKRAAEKQEPDNKQQTTTPVTALSFLCNQV